MCSSSRFFHHQVGKMATRSLIFKCYIARLGFRWTICFFFFKLQCFLKSSFSEALMALPVFKQENLENGYDSV